MAGILCFGFVLSLVWWLPALVRRGQLLYWQNECVTTAIPPNQIVLDTDSSTGPVTGKVATAWDEFYKRYSPPGLQTCGTIFLGEMKEPNGQSRFVAVDLCAATNALETGLGLHAHVFKKRGLFLELSPAQRYDPLVLARTGAASPFASTNYHATRDALVVHAGCLDAGDPSHLSFWTLLNGKRVDYEGWLQNDDTVIIGERKSASTLP
jgi:hypothetical protein